MKHIIFVFLLALGLSSCSSYYGGLSSVDGVYDTANGPSSSKIAAEPQTSKEIKPSTGRLKPFSYQPRVANPNAERAFEAQPVPQSFIAAESPNTGLLYDTSRVINNYYLYDDDSRFLRRRGIWGRNNWNFGLGWNNWNGLNWGVGFGDPWLDPWLNGGLWGCDPWNNWGWGCNNWGWNNWGWNGWGWGNNGWGWRNRWGWRNNWGWHDPVVNNGATTNTIRSPRTSPRSGIPQGANRTGTTSSRNQTLPRSPRQVDAERHSERSYQQFKKQRNAPASNLRRPRSTTNTVNSGQRSSAPSRQVQPRQPRSQRPRPTYNTPSSPQRSTPSYLRSSPSRSSTPRSSPSRSSSGSRGGGSSSRRSPRR